MLHDIPSDCYLLPDSGDSQECCRSGPLEVVQQTSLHHVLVSEVSAALEDERGVNIKHLSSHVAQWQITQHSEIPEISSLIELQNKVRAGALARKYLPLLQVVVPDGHLGCPDNVVVGEHDTLGVASSTTGVDQGGALVDGDAPQS